MVGRSQRGTRRVSLLATLSLSLAAVLALPTASSSAQPAQEDTPVEIPARVQRQVERTGEATFWVRLEGKADLGAAAGISDWAERGQFVYDTLTEFAVAAQRDVRGTLDAHGADYRPFWISNTIRVTGDAAALDAMAAHPDVTAIDAPERYALPKPIETRRDIQVTEWGLDAINAPDVWDDFGVRGEGIVVANIDTGSQFDHPALVDQYRGNNGDGTFDHNYNWFDPSLVCGSPSDEPCDNDGHGTHTMGTMVGDDGAGNQIGVAPGARWIAAKGCESNSCSDFALLESGEWIVAPTDLDGQNPRPDLRPHVVNNSWGGGPGDDWYMDTVDAWIAAGVFPMIANGNAGPSCGSVSSPGDYPQSYGVGAFDINGSIAGFSGRGPSAFGGVKPNVSAPGVNVRSSIPTDSYANFNGTSMATPHASGAVALMLSAAPALIGNIDEVRAIIDQTAVDTEDLTCGGEPGNNNVWGEGKLDALAAVEQSPRGDTATLTGTVTDAVTGDPIAGATVTAVGEIDRTATTDDNGVYNLLLIAGSFDVTAEAYGYAPETTTVDLVAGETTTLDVALDPLPTTVVSGTVTDGSGHGWPLYARLDIDGYPLGPVFTDPVTGAYSVELVESTDFTLNVSAVSGGYVTESRPVTVPPDSNTQDFSLLVDPGNCIAPGYGAGCAPVAGGLVTGNVYDLQTGAPLDDATVTVDADPDATTVSAPTPEDENLDDGFYLLFSPLTGATDITADKALYGPTTETVDVVADGVVEQDFQLGSGQLEVDPDALSADVDLGESTDLTMTISNVGTGPAEFEIRERDRGREVAGRGSVPELAAPGEVEFSGRVKAGPASARSAGARAAGVSAGSAPAAPAAPDWQSGAPLPAGLVRYGFATCEDDPEVFYVISGVSNGSIVNTNYRYDAATDTWTTLAPIPTGQEGPNAACFEGRIYTIGGGGSNQHFVYDIASDSWSAGAPVPQGAAMASAGAFDGKVFYIGGDNDFFPGSGVFDDVYVYDIASNSWSQGTPMPTATSGAGTAQAGEFLYVVGGWGAAAPGSNVNATQRYDMTADTWETGPEFGPATADFALAASGEALYAIAGDNNAGGFFDATAAVHRLDLGSWPSGSWEDLGDPLPSARSANQAGFCTTAKAGGEIYSIAGFTNFIWNSDNLYRETGEGCGGASDVTWLTVDPTEGTVEPGGSTTASVTVDASVPEVDQPGAYEADVVVGGAGADAVTVPVTMNVTVPDNFGKAAGVAAGLARCDAPGAPLEGATVQIGDFTLETDDAGLYEWWLAEGTYPITVTADGYVTQTGEVVITAGATTETDFDLRLDAPCATASPESIELTVPSGDTGSAELTLGNAGAAAYDFEIFETPFDLGGTAATPDLRASRNFTESAEIGPLSVRSVEARGTPSRFEVQAPPWFGGADLPDGRVRYAHAQCDGDTTSFYAISGVNSAFSVDTATWRFDADTNAWTELAPIPTGQEGPSAVCTGGKIYVMGGGGTNQHYIYNIASDTWSAGAPVPRNVWGAAMGAFAGKVYLMGGDSDFNAGGTSNEVNVYDIATDTWSGGPPMPTATVTPGDGQAGQYVYLAGGWGDASPASNLDAVQRFDMSTGSWTTGPTLDSARSDLALAATGTAVYALGGDSDGGGFFDATTTAERLDVSGWPAGTWSAVDPLPLGVSANSAGFCTEEIFGTEVWNVAGGNLNDFGITGRTFFRQAEGEACATIRADVPWLSVDPTAGQVAADSSTPVTVSVDATGLADGEYTATLIVETSDPFASELLVPVTLTVAGEPEPEAAAWVALQNPGPIGGVPVTRSDIAQVNDDGSVAVFFDGSDAGLPRRAHIDAFAFDGDNLLLSFRAPVNVPGLGRVDDSDVVVYDGSGFDLWLDGSDFGLTTDGEDVDALELLSDGTIVVSVLGRGQVPGVSMRAEDLIALDTEDNWSVYFDGSDVGLSSSQENVDAAALDVAGSLDLSTAGRLSADGFTADDDDVAVFEPTELGEDTAGIFTGLLINGSDLGIATNDIVAVEVPSSP